MAGKVKLKETHAGSIYTLRWNPKHKITTTQYALYAVQFAALIILSWAGTISTAGFVMGIYWPEAFYVLFVLWWGWWGIAAVYLGSVIGGGLLTGAPLLQALSVNTCNLASVLLIFLIYRTIITKSGLDPFGRDILSNKLAAFWFLFWIMGVTNIINGIIGVFFLIQFGAIPASTFYLSTGLWILGDAIALILFPFLTKYLTPIVERSGLLVRGWIT